MLDAVVAIALLAFLTGFTARTLSSLHDYRRSLKWQDTAARIAANVLDGALAGDDGLALDESGRCVLPAQSGYPSFEVSVVKKKDEQRGWTNVTVRVRWHGVRGSRRETKLVGWTDSVAREVTP